MSCENCDCEVCNDKETFLNSKIESFNFEDRPPKEGRGYQTNTRIQRALRAANIITVREFLDTEFVAFPRPGHLPNVGARGHCAINRMIIKLRQKLGTIEHANG